MTWRDKLKTNICSVQELKKYIALTPKEERQLQQVVDRHPMSITRYYMSLINKYDPNDPIKRMVFPSVQELDLSGSYDPSGEIQVTKIKGLQHKYIPTALILSTSRCAAYCRYCFRKRLVGISNEEVIRKFSEAANYIREHREITNVLISGGDPFILPTHVIESFLNELTSIPHLHFVRFGTKSPVMFPQRIIEDDPLLSILKNHSRPHRRIYISTQFNHPREITELSIRAVNRLIQSHVILNNQSVLLKDINDDPRVLAELQNRLTSIGVIPYYLFQCRPVKRVKQSFQVPLCKGYHIVEEAKRYLNGHSKRFRYVMSHRTGKIEIVGILNNRMYFKYHEARDSENFGRFFTRSIDTTAGWLDELPVT